MRTTIVEFNRLWVMGQKPLVHEWINGEVMKYIENIFQEHSEVCFQMYQPAGIPWKSPQVLLTPSILRDTTLGFIKYTVPRKKLLNARSWLRTRLWHLARGLGWWLCPSQDSSGQTVLEVVQCLPQLLSMHNGFQALCVWMNQQSSWQLAVFFLPKFPNKAVFNAFFFFCLAFVLDINAWSEDFRNVYIINCSAWHGRISHAVCINVSTVVLNGRWEGRKGLAYSIISFLHLELKPQALTAEILRAVVRRKVEVIKSGDCPVQWISPGDSTNSLPWRERERRAVECLGENYHHLIKLIRNLLIKSPNLTPKLSHCLF